MKSERNIARAGFLLGFVFFSLGSLGEYTRFENAVAALLFSLLLVAFAAASAALRIAESAIRGEGQTRGEPEGAPDE